MFRLPEGFKKVYERKIVDVYEVPKAVPMRTSKRVVIEVLDSFINRLFQSHFLEPTSEIRMEVQVKPVVTQSHRVKR